MACAALKLLLLLFSFSAFMSASTPLDPASLSTGEFLGCELGVAAEWKINL